MYFYTGMQLKKRKHQFLNLKKHSFLLLPLSDLSFFLFFFFFNPSDIQLASVPKTIEVVKIIVPTRTVFNLNNSNTLLISMYKRLFCFATRQLIGLFAIEVTT